MATPNSTSQASSPLRIRDSFLRKYVPPTSPVAQGRGLVVIAGGLESFPSLWVQLRELRRLGSTLPVEVWYCSAISPLTTRMRELLARIPNVQVFDAAAIRKTFPAVLTTTRDLHTFALLNTKFHEVLVVTPFLTPLACPETLFETEGFRTSGAVFWRGARKWNKNHLIWRTLDLAPRDGVDTLAAPALIDRLRHWKALYFCKHLCDHSRELEKVIPAQAQLLNLAWYSTDSPFHEIDTNPPRGTEGESSDEKTSFPWNDLSSRPWLLDESSSRAALTNGATCLQHLLELAAAWKPMLYDPVASISEEDAQLAQLLIGQSVYKLAGTGASVHRLVLLEEHATQTNYAGVVGWHVLNGKLHLGWANGHTRQLAKDKAHPGHWISVERGSASMIRLMPSHPSDDLLTKQLTLRPHYRLSRGDDTPLPLSLSSDGSIGPGSSPRFRGWTITEGQLAFLGERGLTALLRPEGSVFVDSCTPPWQLERHDTRRRYLVHGLQRTCTNVIEFLFSRQLNAPRTTQFFGSVYWKHGWLPSSNALGNTFIIICVRHPLDWMLACYEYFVREHGKDTTICSQFSPTWTFEEFLRRPHYFWPSPAERWNVMNQHWLNRVHETGSGTIVRAEMLQSLALQSKTFHNLLSDYDPFMEVEVDKLLVANRMTNNCSSSSAPMDSHKYWERRYLEQYTPKMLQNVKEILDERLMQQLGYTWKDLEQVHKPN
ncbi:hypothetical protein [Verrucomicrobium spinosum]|uniref:hypothetical protein n=1 Tax=Verrucomicrobium spinosum TaxID=2736 RepID=UPI0009D71895|nr:hypothetical protein [Verrucomicrobium spinosum]